ncbi:MAG: hypothetical protein Fur005_22590 [Roseiflexaceae bacterium]
MDTTATPTTHHDQIAIHVDHVSKMYRIYDQPQDRLKQMLFWRFGRQYGHEFWALRDANFTIRKGEATAIIGRNGSGKSTLLQIIAGTLAPTEGHVQVNGRVAALLELGSGFNPEFTGRENVFLNGAILGLSRSAIEQRLDDILAFADIGEFVDQPIKTYSSGMVVRLAFAVQAHVDPEILIVDEALAVGDVYFQHKCMRRIKEMIDAGTALLLVTHDTVTVKRYCRQAVWLDGGRIQAIGESGVVVEKYLAFMRMREVQDWIAAPIETEPVVQQAEQTDQQAPLIDQDVDLALPGLFVQGQWDLQYHPETKVALRSTSDPQALASFRYRGGGLELGFVCGPSAGAIEVVIDGIVREIDLRAATWQATMIQFEAPIGEHVVRIRPQAAPFTSTTTWLSGRVRNHPALVWHADPHFATETGPVERYGNGKAAITAVELLDSESLEPLTEVHFGQRVRLRLHAKRLQPAGPRLEFSYIIRDRNRIDLCGTTTVDEHIRLDPLAVYFVVEFAFDIRLGPGSYSILVSFVECSEDLSQRVPMDQVDLALVFTVTFDSQRPVWYVFHEPVVVTTALSHEEQP